MGSSRHLSGKEKLDVVIYMGEEDKGEQRREGRKFQT